MEEPIWENWLILRILFNISFHIPFCGYKTQQERNLLRLVSSGALLFTQQLNDWFLMSGRIIS